jgi:hypothetical protein
VQPENNTIERKEWWMSRILTAEIEKVIFVKSFFPKSRENIQIAELFKAMKILKLP